MMNKVENNEASIGIGAMIVFIALILVAAVASAVIIQTAESLQQNAQSIGDDTQEEIAGKIQIHAAHYAAAGSDVHLIFSLAPGSGSILATSINFQTFCIDDAAAFVSDAGTFDDETITDLDGGNPVTTGNGWTGTAGSKYFVSITLAQCALDDVNTGWAAGTSGDITFNIHVTGGGTTAEILDASGTLTDGDSVL